MITCEFCQKEFAFKGTLSTHQKTAKYCLEIQGKECKLFECNFCLKNFTTQQNLNDHISVCKEKEKSQYQTKIKDLEEKLQKLEEKYEDKLEKQKQESRQELEKQKQEYEEKLEKEREVLRQIAMKPTTTNIRDTKNTTINNMNTLNFGDKEKLNRVIRNNINEKVVEQGQVGIAGVVYNNYLKDENGNQMYILLDAARQHFQFRDKDGNLVTDVGAKILTDAVAASNLERETAKIARDIPDLYDNKNKDKFENVMSLTGEFKKDNSTFRKEIVHLAKKDQKVKKEKYDKDK